MKNLSYKTINPLKKQNIKTYLLQKNLKYEK